jgi:phage baseplate assembly protein W
VASSQSFLGTGWGFPPTFVRTTGEVLMTSDEDDIDASLAILMSTTVGERRMQPRYGCNLQPLVFEPVNTTLETYMKDLIETAILYFEPRIVLDAVVLTPRVLEGRIDIELKYTVARTNTRRNFVFPFYKNEGSEVGR